MNQDQRAAVQSALEIFQPFHWGVLHLAILAERARQNEGSLKEDLATEKSELREAYSTVLTSLLGEYQILLENKESHDIGKLNEILPIDLTDEILKIIRTLGEAGRLVQEQNNMNECFQLVEAVYRDASIVEKKLRTLYRQSVNSA